MNRLVLVCASDMHAGLKLGLCNPDVFLQEAGANGDLVEAKPRLNEAQELLWGVWMGLIERAAEMAGKDPIGLVALGELTQGSRIPEELMGTRAGDQFLIAIANLAACYEMFGERLRFARLNLATGWHEFGEGTGAVVVAEALKTKYPEVDTKPLYHGLAEAGGALIDYSHHGPGVGIRSWLEGNQVRYYGRDVLIRSLMRGERAPDLVLRGHVHEAASEVVGQRVGARFHELRVVVTPPMCFIGDYGRKVTRSKGEIVVGGVIVEIVEGRVGRPEFVMTAVDVRTREVFDDRMGRAEPAKKRRKRRKKG